MSEPTVFDRIRQDVAGSDVFLYMKGTPVFPQCGFSAAVVQVLTNLGVRFSSANVLEDPELRDGIKRFSSWPTIPQLYVKGEFVGGCDIVREMYETGELTELLNTRGVPVQLANPA
ncbi:MAG: Grx4 family monothiol glutaredoxin [Rhodospirillales bacterium]